MKNFLPFVFEPKYHVEVAHVFDCIEGSNFADSFVLSHDGISEFLHKIPVGSCTQIIHMALRDVKQSLPPSESFWQKIKDVMENSYSIQKSFEFSNCVYIPDKVNNIGHVTKDGEVKGYNFYIL